MAILYHITEWGKAVLNMAYSLGKKIHELRRDKGLTQEELANKLNVSPQAVSKWENDKSAPDLSLIPVIADMFGVTSDEILRGEKRPAEDDGTAGPGGQEGGKAASASASSARSEKQVEMLLAHTTTRFEILSTVAAGVCLLGLAAAMVCNFGFYRASLGFCIGCCFYIAALICELIFARLAFSAIGGELEEKNIDICRDRLFRIGVFTCCMIVCVFASTLPLTLTIDAYVGILPLTWAVYGAACAAGAVLLLTPFRWLARHMAVKKGIISAKERIQKAEERLKIRTTAVCAAVLALTLLLQLCVNNFATVGTFSDGRTFSDIEEFKKFMETPVFADGTPAEDTATSEDASDPDATYYDRYGNEISEEEALRESLYDENGKLVTEYIYRNETVVSAECGWDGDKPVITVYTQDDEIKRSDSLDKINAGFIIGYFAEMAAVIGTYVGKRRRLNSTVGSL